MEFVVQHAIDNVWAEEIQDKDAVIRPARLTPSGGALKHAMVGMVSVPLPNADIINSRIVYHVYHIGQISPNTLGIDVVENKWMSVDEVAALSECFINVFLDSGFSPPRSKVFIRRMWPGRNIIMAIEHNTSLNYGTHINAASGKVLKNTLNNNDISVRFYTNARYFAKDSRDDALVPDNQFYVVSKPFTRGVYEDIIKDKDHPKQLTGWYLCDGVVYNKKAILNEYPSLMEKEVSIFHDESLLGVKYLMLKDLKTYVSEKNRNIRKYLIDLTGITKDLIYHNDVEYFLGRYSGDSFKGVCIPMMRLDPLSMVTTRTHALRTDVITDIVNKNLWLAGDEKLAIMVVVRKGGMIRDLIHQSSRIESLFRLPPELVESAMAGVNSLLPEWEAANLENNDYAQIMGADRKDITEEMVYNAYGYNALTYYHHPNPLKVDEYVKDEDGDWYIVQLSNAASFRNSRLESQQALIEIIEYDEDGLLVGMGRSLYMNSGRYASLYDPARPVYMVEHFINRIAKTDWDLGEIHTTTIVDNDLDLFGFAAYITTSPKDEANPKWLDVTLQGSYYYLDYVEDAQGQKTRRLVWNTRILTDQQARPMVRINNRVCNLTIPYKSVIKPNRSQPILTVGRGAEGKVQIEPGTFTIWYDGRLLIEDLDYVIDWPNVYISRRLHTFDGNFQVRMSGLADPETSRHFKPRESGFLKDGLLSVNQMYETRDDRNIQINIGGALKHRDDVGFNETGGDSYKLDGRPYQIVDYLTPIELYTERRTLDEKLKSRDIDRRVMDYLNQYLVSPEPDNPYVSDTRWLVVSIFIDEVLGKFKQGWLSNGELDGTWSGSDIEEWVKPFKYLLDFDVGYFKDFDHGYVKLIPHGYNEHIEVTEKQYMLLRDICDLYLTDRIQFNHMVVIQI